MCLLYILTHVESKKIDFPFYDFCMIYYNFSKFIQNKHKRKGGNPLRKTIQEGHMSGYVSLRQNTQFSSLR